MNFLVDREEREKLLSRVCSETLSAVKNPEKHK